MHRAGRRGSTDNHRHTGCRGRSASWHHCDLLALADLLRFGDVYSGTAKTDEKDAFIIADAAHTMPLTLRSIMLPEEEEATLGMFTGFDLEFGRQIAQTSNRIRGLFA